MATESWESDTPLERLLFEEPYRFDFFQAVRLLERIYPKRLPVGKAEAPGQETVRFRTRLSLSFPPSPIYQLIHVSDDRADGEPPQMTVAFMGLTGPSGVLPSPYTEMLVERTRYKDTALWTFLDLFNHRMISLFYRAWEKYRFPIAYERGDKDRFTGQLFSLIGMGTHGLQDRLGLPDEALLLYGGLIAQRPRSAGAIQAILSDYFGVTARLEQFSGQWFHLGEDDLTRLGAANSQLGFSSIAGRRVWNIQSKFRMVFGPLSLAAFMAFLPFGSAFKPVRELLRFLVGLEFDFDIQLTLKAEEVPGCVMAREGEQAPKLGWTSWLKTRPFTADDSQVILSAGG
ncbi:MAG: type VI secretion system baseplate subunit TssG [Acidobacteria bacterium]|nr:type VI secretion system baseplate subunit TssG [Acidobacteriota bacterium]MBI3655361.1 type VI secretion system baseplate subunit TssG [Acidobacteriota bacterium]